MIKNFLNLRCTLWVLMAICFATSAFADHKSRDEYSKHRSTNYRKMNVKMLEEIKNDSLHKGLNRLSFGTNLIEWFTLSPNFTLGIDLRDPKVNNTPQLLLSLKTNMNIANYYDNDKFQTMYGVRAEVRWHYRHNERQNQWRGMAAPSLLVRKGVMHAFKKGDKWDSQSEYVATVTRERQPEKIQGHFYSGIYGEYMNDMNVLFPSAKKSLWDRGDVFVFGFSGGYEIPHFHFNNHAVMHWDFGMHLGMAYLPKKNIENGIFPIINQQWMPIVSDVRVALSIRKTSTNLLYWETNVHKYNKSSDRNRQVEYRVDNYRQIIDSIGGVTIEVTPVGKDSTFKEELTKNDVVRAINKQMHLRGLSTSEFRAGEGTTFPIKGQALNEYYSLNYFFAQENTFRHGHEIENDSLRISIPFKVRLKGYNEGESAYNSFERAVRIWRDKNGSNYPTIYREHLDRESIVGHLTTDDIVHLLDSVSGIHLDKSQIVGIYYKDENSFDRVSEQNVNQRVKKNCYYSVALKFHPQWIMDSSTVATRFVIEFTDLKEMQDKYTRLAHYFSSGARIYIERPWKGGESFDQPVTAEEIINAIHQATRKSADKIDFLKPEMIVMTETSSAYGNSNKYTLNFDPMYPAITDRRVYVRDSVGRSEAESIHKLILDKGDYQGYYRNVNYPNYPTIYLEDVEDSKSITTEMVAEVMSKFYGVHIEPYQIVQAVYEDNKGTKMYNQPWGDRPDLHRGMALVRLHREYPTNIRFYYMVKAKEITESSESSATTANE